MTRKNTKKSGQDVADELQAALGGAGHLGDMIWFSARGVENVRRDAIAADLDAAGLAPYDLAPDAPGPWEALGRARSGWQRGKRNIRIDRERRNQRRSPLLIVRKDARVYDPTVAVSLVDDGAGGFGITSEVIAPLPGVERERHHVDEATQVVSELSSLYHRALDCTSGQEVRSVITEAILGCWGGLRLKEEGHLYWLPATAGFAAEVRALKGAVEKWGRSYVRVLSIADTAANRTDVADGARESFEAEIRDLLDEVNSEGMRASNDSKLQRRLEAYHEVEQRIGLYSELLAERREELLGQLAGARSQVEKLLGDSDARAEERRARRAARKAAQ